MAATPPPAIDSDDDASFGLKFTLGVMEGVTNPNPSPPGKILKSQCATHVCIHIYIHVYMLLKFTVGMIEGCLLISLKYPSVAVCCSVLQCVAVCCSVLQSLVNIPQQSLKHLSNISQTTPKCLPQTTLKSLSNISHKFLSQMSLKRPLNVSLKCQHCSGCIAQIE